MHKSMINVSRWVFVLCCIGWINACTGRPYLIIDYRLPPETPQLSGQAVRLEVKDQREDLHIFTPRARIEFRDFKERYSLAWITEDQSRVLAGEHDLQSLFAEAFAKRLQRLGVQVAPGHRQDTPVFEVELKTFKIDLQNHKWLADVGYVVNLSNDGQWVAHERIIGNAERVKIIGRKGADTVMSDIFTDMLNRVDIIKLFGQARLVGK